MISQPLPTVLRGCLLGLALSAPGCFGTDESHPPPDGPAVLVDVNLPLNADCEVDPGGTQAVTVVSSGLYDIASGTGFCARDYNTHLRIHSFLGRDSDRKDRSEPNIVQVHSVEVTLKSQDNRPLAFLEASPPLPNPFRLITSVSLFPSDDAEPSTASITVKTIPAAYAEYLRDFVDHTVVADIQLFATTTGDVDVPFNSFPFPIQICDGCLTECLSRITNPSVTGSRAEIVGAVCDDDAGQDGRICYDEGC